MSLDLGLVYFWIFRIRVFQICDAHFEIFLVWIAWGCGYEASAPFV